MNITSERAEAMGDAVERKRNIAVVARCANLARQAPSVRAPRSANIAEKRPSLRRRIISNH